MAIDFRRRRGGGESFRSIGSVHGVDPRTVKSTIEKFNTTTERAHWEAVAQNVDTSYLEQHHRLLVVTASGLLSPLTEDFIHHPITEPQDRISESVKEALQLHDTLLKERGGYLVPVLNPALRRTIAKEILPLRYGVKLLNALNEHEPELTRCVEGWSSGVRDFQLLRSKLETEARELWRHLGILGVGKSLYRLANRLVLEAFEAKLSATATYTSAIEFNNSERAQGRLIRLDQKTSRDVESREVYKGSNEDLDTVEKEYERVLSQVKLRSQFEKAIETYSDVQRYIISGTDIIDRIVLTGRPQGRCRLFPGCSMT